MSITVAIAGIGAAAVTMAFAPALALGLTGVAATTVTRRHVRRRVLRWSPRVAPILPISDVRAMSASGTSPPVKEAA